MCRIMSGTYPLNSYAPDYRRTEDEGRVLVRSALATAGDIRVTDDELRVALHPLSAPHRTKMLAAICDRLNTIPSRFPGSTLKLHFQVKPEPPKSLAFPGACPSDDGPKTSPR